MRKFYIRPKAAIVEIDSSELIATSGGAGGTVPGAPWSGRGRSDEDYLDEE